MATIGTDKLADIIDERLCIKTETKIAMNTKITDNTLARTKHQVIGYITKLYRGIMSDAKNQSMKSERSL